MQTRPSSPQPGFIAGIRATVGAFLHRIGSFCSRAVQWCLGNKAQPRAAQADPARQNPAATPREARRVDTPAAEAALPRSEIYVDTRPQNPVVEETYSTVVAVPKESGAGVKYDGKPVLEKHTAAALSKLDVELDRHSLRSPQVSQNIKQKVEELRERVKAGQAVTYREVDSIMREDAGQSEPQVLRTHEFVRPLALRDSVLASAPVEAYREQVMGALGGQFGMSAASSYLERNLVFMNKTAKLEAFSASDLREVRQEVLETKTRYVMRELELKHNFKPNRVWVMQMIDRDPILGGLDSVQAAKRVVCGLVLPSGRHQGPVFAEISDVSLDSGSDSREEQVAAYRMAVESEFLLRLKRTGPRDLQNPSELIKQNSEIQRKINALEPFTRREMVELKRSMFPKGFNPIFDDALPSEGSGLGENTVLEPIVAKEANAAAKVEGLLRQQQLGLGDLDLNVIRNHPQLVTIVEQSKITEADLKVIRDDVLKGRAQRVLDSLSAAGGVRGLHYSDVLGWEVFQKNLKWRTSTIVDEMLKAQKLAENK